MTARIFADIETIPALPDDPAWLAYAAALEADLRSADPPANYKSDEAIGKWRAEQAASIPKTIEAARLKTSLDPALGRIAVLAWAVDGDEVVSVQCDTLDIERAALRMLGDVMIRARAYRLTGHNFRGFDAPYIAVRAYWHGLGDVARMVWRPGAKPWDQPVDDTMDLWPAQPSRFDKSPDEKQEKARKGHTGRSLPTLCRLLGIPTGANPIDGSEVAAAWYDGRRSDVVRHCVEDVRQVREVYRRITGHAV